MGDPEMLTAVNGSIFPVPDKGNVPTLIFVLVQLNTVPGVEADEKITWSVNVPLHFVWVKGCTMSGAAFAV